MNNEFRVHDAQTEDSEDLLDNAVEKTLAAGGEVFVIEAAQMPVQSQVAAVLRY